MNLIIAPSVLAADIGRIADEAAAAAEAGADWIHLDVMDGHFVPPITFGPSLVKAVKKVCSIPLDVHLMIEKPELQLEAFCDAGADNITVHYEACPHLHRTVEQIHEFGAKAGVALNPGTSVDLLKPLLNSIDLILIMTVNPGWGGQKFIESSVDKIMHAKELISSAGGRIRLEVDGGINKETAETVVNAGANVLVAGSYIFGSDDYRRTIKDLRVTQKGLKTA